MLNQNDILTEINKSPLLLIAPAQNFSNNNCFNLNLSSNIGNNVISEIKKAPFLENSNTPSGNPFNSNPYPNTLQTSNSNSNIKKTPKVKNKGIGFNNSDSDYKSDSKNKTPGFKANSQKEFKINNLKLKNSVAVTGGNEFKPDSVLKIQKVTSNQNKKNFSEIYKSPSPVPSKKFRSKYNKEKENNGVAAMTPVKKFNH